MDKDYTVKSVKIDKDSSWNAFSYRINYYHQNNEKFIYSCTYSVADFKKLYWDLDINTLVWQRIGVERKLILK